MLRSKKNKQIKSKNKTNKSPKSHSKKSQLRVIGGQFRGRKLSFESAQGLRPTLDQIRETLFNWLSADIHGAKCLDLFAGSGALGFEALSRGASSVTFVDNNSNSIQNIQNNLQTLSSNHSQIQGYCVNQTSEAFLDKTNEQYDLIFLDPPYDLGFIQKTLETIQPCLTSNALIYIEMESNLPLDFLNNYWEVKKIKTSSRLSYALIELKVNKTEIL